MASIVDRGTRSEPKFFAKYDFVDASGERKQRWKLLAGVQDQEAGDAGARAGRA